MSPGPADQVNAKELAGRERRARARDSTSRSSPRLIEAGGARRDTRGDAQLRFGTVRPPPDVDARVDGVAVLTCQRCLQPCECTIDESALLMVVRDGRRTRCRRLRAVAG